MRELVDLLAHRLLDGAGKLAGAFDKIRADVTLSRIGLEQGYQPGADQEGRDRRAMGETPGQAGADRQGGDRVGGSTGLDLVQDPVRRILRGAGHAPRHVVLHAVHRSGRAQPREVEPQPSAGVLDVPFQYIELGIGHRMPPRVGAAPSGTRPGLRSSSLPATLLAKVPATSRANPLSASAFRPLSEAACLSCSPASPAADFMLSPT